MSSALLSCLGVSGWGPLHWWLPRDAGPEALLFRLRQAWCRAAAAGAPEPRATLLLASLLRDSGDLIPWVAAPLPPAGARAAYRHRLVCRPTAPWLHLRSWEHRGMVGAWHPCGQERCLDVALLSLGQAPAASCLRWPGLSSRQEQSAAGRARAARADGPSS